MSWLSRVGVAGVIVAQVSIAAAADMPSNLPPPPAWHAPQPFEFSHGWYLRGDIGYAWGTLDGAASASPFVDPTDSKLQNVMTGGLGAGFKSKWLRTDLTVDYLAPMAYTGTVAVPGDVSAKISAVTALFNGYLDLGTWYRVTPYIGAGAGIAYVSIDDFASAAVPPFTGGAQHQWNFAWALMGGIDYPVAPNLKLDIGYRYLDLGDVRTASDAFGHMTFKNVAAHEVRAGLRWSFDDFAKR